MDFNQWSMILLKLFLMMYAVITAYKKLKEITKQSSKILVFEIVITIVISTWVTNLFVTKVFKQEINIQKMSNNFIGYKLFDIDKTINNTKKTIENTIYQKEKKSLPMEIK